MIRSPYEIRLPAEARDGDGGRGGEEEGERTGQTDTPTPFPGKVAT